MSRRDVLKLALLALAILLLGLTPYPRDFVSAMRQATTHRAARESGAALAAYQRAAASDPASYLPWLRRGEILLQQRRFLPALRAFTEAEHLGGGPDALLGRGESYAGTGDWSAAIRTWLQAQALNPDDARVYVALGRGSLAQGQLDQAKRYLARTLELQPANAEAALAHALLGRLLSGEDPVQAANHFRQAGDRDMLAVLDAVDAEPDPARRVLLLGIAALQRGELPLARHHFERAIALAPTDAEAHAYLAHTLDQSGETAAAGDLLDRALNLDGDSALVYYFMGTHQRRVGNVEAAQDALWLALRRDPENAALRTEMAETFVDLSDYASAEEWYRGAVAAAPEEVDFALMLVRFYVDHIFRVEEGGVPAALALVELAPDDARAYDLLGWAYHLAGQQAAGEQALLRALSLDPDLVGAHYHLGSLYLTLGRHEPARRYLGRAVDLDLHGYYRDRARLMLKDLE